MPYVTLSEEELIQKINALESRILALETAVAALDIPDDVKAKLKDVLTWLLTKLS